MTKAECELMIDTAKKNDRKLTVGYQWRYRPETLYIKDYCAAGKLGNIYYAKAHGTRFAAFLPGENTAQAKTAEAF